MFNIFDSIINLTKLCLHVDIIFLSISLETLLTLVTLRSNSKFFRKKVLLNVNIILFIVLYRLR